MNSDMNKDVEVAVIEDDENLSVLVSHRLQSEGYSISEASNGADAEELIMTKNTQRVLLDWMLPVKAGCEVCKNIREKGFTGIVVMMTAKAQDIDKIDAYNFGV